MAADMSKAEYLDDIRHAREEWDALLVEVGTARMTEPGAAGTWSVKDIVAHITWGEREMVEVLRARALIGSELWDLRQDERNAVVYAENRDRPLDEVLAESRQVAAELYEAIAALDEQDLIDASRFRDMPADWVPWEVLAGNTYEHYHDHTRDVRAWLAKS
jgi:hypothetical protein